MYSPDVCGMKPWYQNKVNCSALVSCFPFVQHVRGPGGTFCREELVVQGRITKSFTRTAQGIPVC